MRSRSTGAHPTRALAVACLVTALIVSMAGLTGCDLLVGETTTTPSPPKEATGTAEATSTAEATGTAATEAQDAGEAEALAPSGVAPPKPVDDAGADSIIKKKARIICVDTKSEYDDEHVKGASSVPLRDLASKSDGWKETSPVLVTSRTEAKSVSAAGYLIRQGFTDVYYLESGHEGWNGKFEGDNPPTRTIPCEVYYIYSSDDTPPYGYDVAGGTTTIEDALDVNDQMEAIRQVYGEVSITMVDWSKDPSEAMQLVDRFDIPHSGFGSSVTVDLPHWVLVDRDGNVVHLNVWYRNFKLCRVFGFIQRWQDAAAQ